MKHVQQSPSRWIGALAVIIVGYGSIVAFAAEHTEDLPRRGYLGIQVAPLPDTERAKHYILPGQGIIATHIVAQSPANVAGMQVDDVILKIGEIAISDVTQFLTLVRGLPVGQPVSVVFLRNGTSQTLTLTVQPRPQESHPEFDILYRSVTVNGTRRRVIITKPKTPGRHRALLLVNGIGCYLQDMGQFPPSHPTRQLLYTLTQQGMVTMRVEKSGMGDSEGPPCDSPQVDLQAEVSGYVAGLRALQEYDFVDPKRVFLLGLSIGGIVGPLVAREVGVTGMIVFGTVSTDWRTYEVDNLRRQFTLRGVVAAEEIETLARQKRACNERLYTQRQTPSQIAHDAPHCPQLPIQPPAPYTYMQQVAALNLTEMWQATTVPVLALYGTSDFLTTAAEHEHIANILNRLRPGQVQFKQIEGMDHFLVRAPSPRDSMTRVEQGKAMAGEFHPAVVQEIIRWLARFS